MTEPARCADLEALREDVRAKALLWLATLRSAGGRAKHVVIGETARSVERQDWLYASGRTREGPVVTQLHGRSPNARHVAKYGEATAWDFWFRVPDLSPWDEGHPWTLAGVLGEYHGMRWGGRWKTADLGHLEFNGPNVATAKPVLRRGARGERVRMLQQSLAARGFVSVGPADGVFGARTERAVMAFEEAGGLRVDGEVDAVVALRLGIAS